MIWQIVGAILIADVFKWLLSAAVKTYYPQYLQWREFRRQLKERAQ